MTVILNPADMLLLRLEAMHSVYAQDSEFVMRCIRRWYSERYNTPLHEVGTPEGKVSVEDLLATFYEVRYHEMDEPKREVEVNNLVQTPEEAEAEARAADVAEAENWLFARQVERMEAQKKAREKAKEDKKRLDQMEPRREATMERDMPIPNLVDNGFAPRAQVQPPSQQLRQPKLDPGPDLSTPYGKPSMVDTTLPEDVKVVFMTDEEMEREVVDPFSIERPAGPRKKKPKK